MAQEPEHPLDREDVSVIVMLTHGPTLATGMGTVVTHTDDGFSVTEIIAQAGQHAMDDMLAQLEQR